MKRWVVPLLGLILTVVTAGAVTACALTGDGSDASSPQDAALPPLSAMCVEDVPDCDDMLVVGLDEGGAIEPDFGEDGPYLVPDRDVECGPDQGIAITSDGQVSCVGVRDLPGTPGKVEPQTPIRSDEGIDPNECNWVHNIDACSDTGSGSVGTEGVPGPGIAVGEPYLLPTDKACGSDQAVALTSDGRVSCFDLGDGTGMANDEPGGQVVEPQPPVTSVTSIADGQAPTGISTNEYMTVLRLAREDLSQRIAVEIGSIRLAELERAGWPVYWPEEPVPGVAYIEIALAGFRMVLEADGQTYEYETDTSERVVFVG